MHTRTQRQKLCQISSKFKHFPGQGGSGGKLTEQKKMKQTPSQLLKIITLAQVATAKFSYLYTSLSYFVMFSPSRSGVC